MLAGIQAGPKNEELNYLNYYAVDNSLDGQIMADKQNVLRFFPVFVIQQKIEKVNVTLYYGAKIFNSQAVQSDDNKYWEVFLPRFSLGEAIQRIEVEIKIKLDDSDISRLEKQEKEINDQKEKLYKDLTSKLEDLKPLIASVKEVDYKKFETEFDTFSGQIITSNLVSDITKFSEATKETESNFISENKRTTEENEKLKQTITDLRCRLNGYSASLKKKSKVKTVDIDEKISEMLNILQKVNLNDKDTMSSHLITTLKDEINKLNGNFSRIVEKNQTELTNVNKLQEIQTNIQKLEDKITEVTSSISNYDKQVFSLYKEKEKYRNELFGKLTSDFTEASYSGQSIQRSDFRLDDNNSCAYLLYRNYKSSLRDMPALDPAERIGLFRARFVPFPVASIKNKPNLHLIPITGDNSSAVFEFGIGFGNPLVPGDNFVVPEISIKRFSVSIALTQKLFDEDADIKALALTYDVNTYVSIGFGANFARDIITPYYSVGINKKLFEVLLKGMAGVFKQ
jgi:hypothetical protein